MNACCVAVVESDPTNDAIDKTLREEARRLDSELRLLLLGPGDSGKSTIAKQMKIIHMGGFHKGEMESFIPIIRRNIWECVQALISASDNLQIGFSKNLNLDDFEVDDPTTMTPSDGKRIAKLWADPGTQNIYNRRSEFQLHDSCQYLMDHVDRISSVNYFPTEQDALRTRVQTQGILETRFQVDGAMFTIVDVGGQRSERKKWIHCFENVTGVVFCVGLSGFDQVIEEDMQTNRLREALKLFHEICQTKWFTQTAIILFLNKDDLFRAKLEAGKSISIAFDDYTGPTDYSPSIKFIVEKFQDTVDPFSGKPRQIFVHVTCATDTSTVRVVFKAIKETLVNVAFAESGLM